MVRSVKEYASDWQENAEADAFYSILTNPKFYGGKWNATAFYKTGEAEISRLFSYMQKASIATPNGLFMDFGCGAGRTSKALRKRFTGGYGVDISPKMISLANSYVQGVSFFVNQRDYLEYFADQSVDFIYSHIALQHIPNDYQKRYINEFMRIISRGGLAVFQVPIEVVASQSIKQSFTHQIKQKLKECFPSLLALKRKYTASNGFHFDFKIEMHALPFEEVKDICDARGCVIEAHPSTNSCERDHNGKIEFYDLKEERGRLEKHNRLNRYLSCMFFVRKPTGLP
jgi:ubiquinone/menaquinone biosynthesis C-methylase UbiE